MRKPVVVLLAALLFSLASLPVARAQFKSEAFSQSYNNDTAKSDSVDTMFSFKEYFGGLAHKNEIKIGTSFAGACVFVGGQQIYNKQYWKLPIVYSTILGAAGTGVYFNMTGKQDIAKYCFIGAGVAYWATLLDGVVSYKPDDWPLPGKATLYSLLVPGLGQIYNHEIWKLPIYLGGLVASVHFYDVNQTNYERFRRIYIEATDTEVAYTGPISAETAKYYRDIYRRYRDYSVLAIGLIYLIQVIDANVFSYMHDFEITDDLSLNLAPALIMPESQYAYNTPAFAGGRPALGVRFGFNF